MWNPYGSSSNREADLRKAVLRNNLRIPGPGFGSGAGLITSTGPTSEPSAPDPSSAWSWSSSEGSPGSALSPSEPSTSPRSPSTTLQSPSTTPKSPSTTLQSTSTIHQGASTTLQSPSTSPGSLSATLQSPTNLAPAEPGPTIRHIVLEPTSPIPDWDEIVREQRMRHEADDPGRKLRKLYLSCTTREAAAPTMAEITALGAGKEQLVCTLRDCARWICSGADRSITKNQNVETAEALLRKWKRCNADAYEVTTHMEGLADQRSEEELEAITRDAFADIYELLADAEGDEKGYPIVKVDARPPDPGQEWY